MRNVILFIAMSLDGYLADRRGGVDWLRGQDPGAEEWEQILSINALLAEIARHREEIKQIKGVTKCPGCGAEVPLHAAYCSACGARVPAEETAAPAAPGTRVCPCCGAPAEADSAFCNSCGTRL